MHGQIKFFLTLNNYLLQKNDVWEFLCFPLAFLSDHHLESSKANIKHVIMHTRKLTDKVCRLRTMEALKTTRSKYTIYKPNNNTKIMRIF